MITISVHAQLTNTHLHDTLYDFSTFAMPEIHFRSLQLTADASSGGRWFDNSSFSPGRRLYSAGVRGVMDYYSYVNTPLRQNIRDLSGSTIFSWDRDRDDFVEREQYAQLRLSGVQHLRKYDGSQFRELSLVHYGLIAPESIKENTDSEKVLTGFLELKPYLLLGKGRLEPIDDVNIGFFLIDDLARHGMLRGQLSQDELNQLGHRMANARLRRVFDFRELRRSQFKSIDTLFQQQDWVVDRSIDYFTILADNWLYAFRYQRNSGKRLSYGVSPLFQYSHQFSREVENGVSTRTTADVLNTGAFAVLQYRSEVPISVKWHRFFSIGVEAGYEYFRRKGTGQLVAFDIKESGPAGQIYFEYGRGYYPSSRTRWVSAVTGQLKGRDFDDFGYTAFVGVNTSLSYFLSPRARLDGRFDMGWTGTDNFGFLNTFNTLIAYSQAESPLYQSPVLLVLPQINNFHVGFEARLTYQLF